jgi:hypothetical protein
MNEILDRAVEHQRSKEVNSIRVDEWDCDIYFTEMSLAERKKLLKLSGGDGHEIYALAVILKAMDKEGNKLFDISAKQTFMASVDANVVRRISEAISSSSLTPEEAEKN